MRGTIHVHGCGGMGINGTSAVQEVIEKLGGEFAEIKLHTIDTTDKTIAEHPNLKEVFFKIKSTLLSDGELDGMAGERRNTQVIGEIGKNIKRYLDETLKDVNMSDYHVVIFSGSGGSGSVISALLIKELIGLGSSVMAFMVADTSNLLFTNNSINSIASLNAIAKAGRCALPVAYFDNNYDGYATPNSEEKINDDIGKLLSIVALYTSGQVRDIDHQDMSNFFRPTNYESITIDPGLYRLTASVGKLSDSNTLLARTLLKQDMKDVQVDVLLMHNKVGYVTDGQNDAISNGKDHFPMFLTLEKNYLNTKADGLKKRYDELEGLKIVNTTAIDGLTDSSEDESGLIV